MQAYSDPTREHDEHALPDIEVFQITATRGQSGLVQNAILALEAVYDADNGVVSVLPDVVDMLSEFRAWEPSHWYWWSCFPGCLPDSDPIGPFETQELALADAQEHN